MLRVGCSTITVIKENTNRSSFCKLNGEAREEPTKPEGEVEVKALDGRQELHCHCLDDPNYEYDPNNDEDRCLIWTPPDGCTSTELLTSVAILIVWHSMAIPRDDYLFVTICRSCFQCSSAQVLNCLEDTCH